MSDPMLLNPDLVKNLVEQAVEQQIMTAVRDLGTDTAWLEKIEHQVNQAMVDNVVMRLAQIDLTPIIQAHVERYMSNFRQEILTNFVSTGIRDQATQCQVTVMDDITVVENQLTTRSLTVANTATMQDLVVKGTVNIDNPSWQQLAEGISEKTLSRLSEDWRAALTQQVATHIQSTGIEFDQVLVGGEVLVAGNALGSQVTDTNIQQTGTLRTLEVAGESTFNNQTLNVMNRRVGVNTVAPEMALSVWDEEVSVVMGKNQANEAYIGTNRAQGVAIGVNRTPQIEISADGVTRIKQLQVGLHRISHGRIVPGWSGTRGDLVFNSEPGDDGVFAWVCLGAYQWRPLRSA